MADFARVEFWNELEAAGGTRRALVTGLLACREQVSLEGEDTLRLELMRDNPALVTLDTVAGETNAEPSAVVRLVMSDGAVIERRISALSESDRQGELRTTLTARGMMHELSLRGLVARTYSNTGVRSYAFEVVGLTPSQLVATYVLPALAEAGQPFWEAGTIHADSPVTVVFDRDTPIGALRKIAAATSEGLELAVRYDLPRKKYLLDLVRQVGSSAAVVRVHAGVNLVQLAMGRAAEDLVTRIYGFGAADDELGTATMGKNAWIVAGLAGGGSVWTAQLLDPAGGPDAVAIQDQYNETSEGKHWLIPVGRPELTSFQITATDATSGRVTMTKVDAGLGLPGGNPPTLYRLARGWTDALLHGTRTREMSYVQDPAANLDHGARVGYVDRADASGVLNHLRNPLARLWGDGVSAPANLPLNWTTANITASKETSQWRSGGASLRASFLSTDALLTIFDYLVQVPSGLISFFADVQALSGHLAVKLIVTLQHTTTLPDGSVRNAITYPDDLQRLTPALPYIPTLETVQTGAWERVGMAGAHDASRYPAIACRVIVVPGVGLSGASGLIDAAQVTNTATQRELVEGSGSNILVQQANSNLVRYAGLAHNLDVDVLDLTTMDEQRFPYNEYTLGGRVVVRDERLGRAVTTRVLGWDRDWLAKEMLTVQISNAGAGLSEVLAQRAASARPELATGGLR